MDYYRRVPLLNVVSKWYTSVLNARLYLWLEENDAITECEDGFYYSTVDRIFKLHHIVKNKMLKKERAEIVCCI